ncbi:DUF3574 domain-containing protein [Thalassotalea litorea]|uniref:DUF3574 domain-containing protein n=1 Tax=Thalassotalea litorea TaxID=2020715 RepID=A0A5R9IBN3_9GAMM|nr:DUF3574 domain-containing protein [Thalassotalea litorea]
MYVITFLGFRPYIRVFLVLHLVLNLLLILSRHFIGIDVCRNKEGKATGSQNNNTSVESFDNLHFVFLAVWRYFNSRDHKGKSLKVFEIEETSMFAKRKLSRQRRLIQQKFWLRLMVGMLLMNLVLGCQSLAENEASPAQSNQSQVYQEQVETVQVSTDVVVHMYFGLTEKNGSAISEKRWLEFEKNTLAQRLIGFTVFDSKGYYQGQQERSKVVVFVTTKDKLETVTNVCDIYRVEFNQQSVMVTVSALQHWLFVEGD